MKTTPIKYFLLYFLTFACTTIFLKLWDTWKWLLSGESLAIDWTGALRELEPGKIIAITLPVALLLTRRKIKKERDTSSAS